MRISPSVLSVALARQLAGPLRYTDHYPPQILELAWRRTGLRKGDLAAALQQFCERGWLKRLQVEGHERYRLTIDGSVELYGRSEPRWKHWREDWVLQRLRQRRRAPSAGITQKRRNVDG